MQVEVYRKFLKNKNIPNEVIENYIKLITDFDEYLLALGTNGVDKSHLNTTQKYLKESKLTKEEKEVFNIALKYYGLAIGKANVFGNANKLMGKSTWMVRLEDTIEEHVGTELRDKIMEIAGEIKDTSSKNKKVAWTKRMIDALEANVDEAICKKILANNLHYQSPTSPSFKKLRTMYKKTGSIDTVLSFLHETWKTRMGEKYGYDSPEYEYVAKDPTNEAGRREGNIIYVSKIPFKISEFLNATEDKLKRFYYCHCGWVRAAIPKSEEEQISPTFCNCSGGWHKIMFEVIYEQTLKVEVVKTVLKGDHICTFAIHIPEKE
ncbi:MAG: DUF6144 family protein [Candidatus Heimdallarchaeota archaeon]